MAQISSLLRSCITSIWICQQSLAQSEQGTAHHPLNLKRVPKVDILGGQATSSSGLHYWITLCKVLPRPGVSKHFPNHGWYIWMWSRLGSLEMFKSKSSKASFQMGSNVASKASGLHVLLIGKPEDLLQRPHHSRVFVWFKAVVSPSLEGYCYGTYKKGAMLLCRFDCTVLCTTCSTEKKHCKARALISSEIKQRGIRGWVHETVVSAVAQGCTTNTFMMDYLVSKR